MSSLKILDKECFEDLFGMGSGYVLDFSNRTFNEFIRESARIDIYAEKYALGGDSKAKRLRAFFEIEPDSVVGKTLADLLDYWRYKNAQPSVKQAALVDRAERIIERLLGKQMRREDLEEEFLKRRFGEQSLKNIRIDAALVPILESRFSEAVRCLKTDAPLAVIFHCGSILEGLLLGVACVNPQKFNQAPNSPKDKSGTAKHFHDWTLAEFIDVACELGYLKLDVKKFGHSLRDFRNYIHPYQQMSSGFKPDKHTAEICLQVLRAAFACLSGERKP
jgi:hypothetical protein